MTLGTAWLIGFSRRPLNPLFSLRQVGLIVAGGMLIAAISWLDDIRHGLSPGVRLIVHLAAAGLALIAAGGWSRIMLPFLGTVKLGWAGSLVALVWIVGLVNAYNFMDGIDGIAGVQTVSAAAGWFVVGQMIDSPILTATGLLLGCSAIGFLVHNWPPAKIFMGDIGSAFLGYCFAVLPLVAGPTVSVSLADRIPVAALLMVAPFVVDATFTFLRRLARREKLSQAHRSHIYQRLIITGLSHRIVTLLYLGLGFVGSAAGLAFLLLSDRMLAGGLVLGALAVIWLVPLVWVLSRERIADNIK